LRFPSNGQADELEGQRPNHKNNRMNDIENSKEYCLLAGRLIFV
jgi:hypothetical protein